jgi:hypothetical protein
LRTGSRSTPLALAGIVLVGALVLWTQARQIHLWAPDEEYFVQLSRLVAGGFPDAVVNLPIQPFDHRGIQRLTILVLALPLGVVNGELGVDLGRFLMCLAFTSAAIPAYLIASGSGLSRAWALLAATLTIVTPWAVLTGSFLSESVAYAVATWALWGAWRACLKPGLASDVLAVALAVFAGLGRTNLLVLIVIAPLATLLHTWATVGYANWRDLPGRMWRDHPLFAVLIPPGAVIVLLMLVGIKPGPIGSLAGNYIVSLDQLDFGILPEKFSRQDSRVLTGVGVLPLLVGVPWIIGQIRRRSTPATGALALTALVGYLVLQFSTVYAAPEERYIFLVTAPLIVACVAAIVRRETPAWAIAVTGVIAGVLVWRIAWPFQLDPARFLTDPSESFVGRVVLSRLPGNGQLAFGLLVVAAACALAFVLGRGRASRPWVPAAVLGVVALLAVVQTGYIVGKRTELSNGPGTLADWTWVDDRVGDARVGLHALLLSNSDGFLGNAQRDMAFFNRRVDRIVSSEPVTIQIPRYGKVIPYSVAPDGTLAVTENAPIPRWLVQPTEFVPRGLVGDVVERSSYLPLALLHLEGAPRVLWDWDAPEPDGWFSRERPTATVQAFPPALRQGRCLQVTLSGPAEGSTRFTARGDRIRASGRIGSGEKRTFFLPLRRGTERLTIRTTGIPQADEGRSLGPRISETRVGDC